MVFRVSVATVACAVAASAANPDPLWIVQRAIALTKQNETAAREYAMTQESIKREIGSDGKVRSTTTETFEVHPIAGEPLQKLIRRNGQPLSPEEARKAHEKFAEGVREREKETPEQRQRRMAKYEHKLSQRRQMLDELPAAFTFQIEGEETVDGHEAWRIQAKQRPGYEPKSARTAFLAKMEGRFWISKQHNRLIKVDAVTTGPVSFGWILAKLAPGSRVSIEQMKLTDDIWVLRRFKLTYDMRIALVKLARGETEQIMWDFRRPAARTASGD